LNNLVIGLVIGVIGSLIAAGIIKLVSNLVRTTKNKKSPYSGIWETEIFSESDTTCTAEAVKKEALDVIGKIEKNIIIIKGHIKRDFPHSENKKRWDFRGSIIGETMICVFWSIDRPVGSCGCWVQRHKAGNTYQGFYLKYDNQPHKIRMIPLKTSKSEN